MLQGREDRTGKRPIIYTAAWYWDQYFQWRAIAAAKSHEDIYRYAEWAVASADEYGGRAAPVATIRKKMRNGGDETPVWEKRWDKVVELLELIAVDDLAGREYKRFCQQVLSAGKDKGLI